MTGRTNKKYSQEELDFIKSKRRQGHTFEDIADMASELFEREFTTNMVAGTCKRKGFTVDDSVTGELLKKNRRQHKDKLKNNKKIREILDEQISKEDRIKAIESAIKSVKFTLHKKVKQTKPKKVKRAIVMHMSDTHFGADIDPEEMGGLNGYGRVEEARRTAFLTKETANYKKSHRKETELVIVYNGDMVQGTIHSPEAYEPMTSQFARCLNILTQQISYLSQHFAKVRVVCIGGNHDRRISKSNKGRQTQEKYDNHFTDISIALRTVFARDKHINFEIPVTPYALIDILGHRYFITHSDTVFNTGTIGKTVSTQNMADKLDKIMHGLGKIDVVLVGHTHVSVNAILNNGIHLLANGCMSGIDPYCQAIGIFSSVPTQTIFEVTDEFSVGDTRVIRVAVGDEDKELDKIIKPLEGKF